MSRSSRVRARTTMWRKEDQKLYGVQARVNGKWMDVIDSRGEPLLFPTQNEAERHREYVKVKLQGGTTEEASRARERLSKRVNRG